MPDFGFVLSVEYVCSRSRTVPYGSRMSGNKFGPHSQLKEAADKKRNDTIGNGLRVGDSKRGPGPLRPVHGHPQGSSPSVPFPLPSFKNCNNFGASFFSRHQKPSPYHPSPWIKHSRQKNRAREVPNVIVTIDDIQLSKLKRLLATDRKQVRSKFSEFLSM